MALAEEGRDTLARALTTAYPAVGDRLRLLSAAGLGHVQASGDALASWRGAVDEAIAANALDKLLAAAGRDDAWLAGLAADVAAGRPPGAGFRRKLVAGLVLVSVVLGAGIVALTSLTFYGVDPTDRPVTPESRPARAVPVAPDPVAAEPVVEPIVEPVVPPEPVVPREPVVAPVPSASAADDECGAPDADGRIGWVYVGEREPKVDGDRLVLPTAGNVRADYPRKENRWSAHAKARCWPPKGTHVRLAGEVAAIPPHDFWAPIGAIER